MTQNLVRTKLPALDPTRLGDGGKLDLKVIFTDLSRTAAALKTARAMASGLSARITVLLAQVVPYPLPLAAPPVSVEFTRRLLESVAADENTKFEILLCRDRYETLHDALLGSFINYLTLLRSGVPPTDPRGKWDQLLAEYTATPSTTK